jgi:hypothetical protein
MPREGWLLMTLHSRSGSRGAFIAIRLALVACEIFSTAGRAAAEVICPDTIAVAQNAAAAGEWQVRDSGEKPELERVTIYEGPPKHQASLKYDREIKRKSEIVQMWNLPPSKEGYWLACGYSNTSKQLYRKLPAMTAICGVTFDRGVNFPDGSPVIRRVRCRAK